MSVPKETREEAQSHAPGTEPPVPGVLLVVSANRPTLSAVPIDKKTLTLGRASESLQIDDDLTSRKHAEVHYDGQRWFIRDLSSRNGTYVDGVKVDRLRDAQAKVIRIGHSLFILLSDVRPYLGRQVMCEEARVMGPALQDVHAKIHRYSQIGDSLHISGPSGSGKELAAQAFHQTSRRASGPFIPVNCAAIPDGVAERLLFGSVKGAFSGADDAEGYIQSAHRGTLFLDELGELDLKVQAKLLRVLEAKEVTRLGTARPTPVDLQVVSATHHDLRSAVAEGRFREDLYFRVARPALNLPSLIDRPEEIPWLIDQVVVKMQAVVTVDVTFVEACLLRVWPGNVRELIGEVERSVHEALADQRTCVTAPDLDELAGRPWTETTDKSPRNQPSELDRDTVKIALKDEAGNVSATARRLGLHRNQLRRFMAKFGLDKDTLD